MDTDKREINITHKNKYQGAKKDSRIRALFRERSHKKQIKNKNDRNGRYKNRIKFIITSKNFSKMFQSQEMLLDILCCL